MPPKQKPDPKDYRFRHCKGEELVKRAGQVNGLDFVVDGCEDCTILILDHVSQIFVDFCKRCTIVVGAVASSIFIRDCESCRVLVVCGQLRTRDCTDCDILVQVQGQPIVETSKNMRFGPVLRSYDGAAAHVEAAGLAKRFQAETARCQWTKVYDFSPNDPPGGNHWSAMSRAEADKVAAAFPAEIRAVPVSWPTDPFPEGDGEAAADVTMELGSDGSDSIEEVASNSIADGGFGGRLHEVRASARSSPKSLADAVKRALEEGVEVDGAVWLVALGSAIPAAAAAAAALEAEAAARIGCVQTGLQGSQPRLRVACRRAAPSKGAA